MTSLDNVVGQMPLEADDVAIDTRLYLDILEKITALAE